ncbi:hypothetical protein BDD12DRAFT_887804 [Trichophaea hybrida]|nr:hypothetical protein BDD12DRAFT_887804 [Trichophaea hybrida]
MDIAAHFAEAIASMHRNQMPLQYVPGAPSFYGVDVAIFLHKMCFTQGAREEKMHFPPQPEIHLEQRSGLGARAQDTAGTEDVSTVSLNRDDTTGAEGNVAEEEDLDRERRLIKPRQWHGVEDCEHRLIKPGRWGCSGGCLLRRMRDCEHRVIKPERNGWSGGCNGGCSGS